MINDNDLARIAAMAHALRPDWPTRSLLSYLHAKHTHHPHRDLAVALAWIAADPATKTPARLDENGPWWTAANAETPATTPTPPLLRTCKRCGNCHTFADEPCASRAHLDHAKSVADGIRRTLRETRAERLTTKQPE